MEERVSVPQLISSTTTTAVPVLVSSRWEFLVFQHGVLRGSMISDIKEFDLG
jgi:hypothetical protein